MKRQLPKLIYKLRFLCKDHPDQVLVLKNAAMRIERSMISLGITTPARAAQLGVYRDAENVHFRITGEAWDRRREDA